MTNSHIGILIEALSESSQRVIPSGEPGFTEVVGFAYWKLESMGLITESADTIPHTEDDDLLYAYLIGCGIICSRSAVTRAIVSWRKRDDKESKMEMWKRSAAS